MSRHGSRALIVALLLFSARSSWAAFGYNSPITIDHTKVPSTQTDFPVLISLTDNRFRTIANGGNVQSATGYDIRPFSDNACSSAFTYELERYNPVTGEVVMWVKIGSLSSSVDTVIYLGYGDVTIVTDGSSTATWSNNFLGVYHLKDGTTLAVTDSTGANNGTNHGVTATSGTIDGAGGFVAASSQYVDLGTGIAPTAITLSAWVNATTFPTYSSAITRIAAASASYAAIQVKSTGKLAMFAKGTGDVSYDGTGTTTLSTATWYYLTLTYSSAAGLVGYVNASSDGTHAANGNLATNSGSTSIGADSVNAGGRFWNGKLDEVRAASVARSADWITVEWNNQSAAGLATFETLGTEVTGCPAAATPTSTPTSTPTNTPTPTATATFTPTPSATFTPTATPSNTPTPTATATATATPTNTPTPTPSATATPTPLAAPWFLFFPQNG